MTIIATSSITRRNATITGTSVSHLVKKKESEKQKKKRRENVKQRLRDSPTVYSLTIMHHCKKNCTMLADGWQVVVKRWWWW